ncbi:MAG: hypothetical protein J5759_01605 [Bacteroidales bacterium]|nr:hypothetical protein [Bacteroidales bacterium]
MKRIAVLLLLASCICCTGEVSQENIINKANRLMQEHPDSALVILNQVDTTRIRSNRQRAEYALSYVVALDKNHIDTTNTSLLDPAMKYYRVRGSSENRMKVHYYLGCIQSNAGDYTSAFASYNTAWREALNTDNSLAKGMISAAIGIVYNNNYIAEEELYYFKEAYNWFSEYGDSLYIDNALYLLAKAYHNNHLFTKADSLYSKVNRNSRFASSALLGRATNTLKGPGPNPEKALEFFNKAQEMGAQLSLDEWYQYVYALYLTGNRESADNVMKLLEKVDKDDDLSSLWWKYSIALNNTDYEKALTFLQKFSELNNSVVHKQLQQSLYKIDKDQYLIEAELSQQAKDRSKTGLAIVSLVALLLLSLASLFYFRMKSSVQQRSAMLEQQVSEAQRMTELVMLNAAEEKRTTEDKLLSLRASFAAMYQAQFSKIGQLYEKELGLSLLFDKAQQDYADQVRDILSEIGDRPEQQKQFEARIDRDMDNIMKKMRADFPGFSDESFRLLSYFVVGFHASTIASIMCMDSGAVRTRKSRLKKQILSADSPNHQLYEALL